MTLAEIAFFGFSALAIGASLAILWTRNVMYAALCLFVGLLGVAALYVLAGQGLIESVRAKGGPPLAGPISYSFLLFLAQTKSQGKGSIVMDEQQQCRRAPRPMSKLLA